MSGNILLNSMLDKQAISNIHMKPACNMFSTQVIC